MTETEYRRFFPNRVRCAVRRLNDCGYEAYLVGGCVRDFYRGCVPDDFDITTDATSEEILACFEQQEESAYLKGGNCGTVGVGRGKDEIELTPFRTENGYYDHRHPQTVRFVKNLFEDLARRDFTMNSLAVGYTRAGNFTCVDPFGGREDIRNRVIRCVGDPYVRFDEDALRILRALRFAATFGFSIEEKTAKALRERIELVTYVSGERKHIELQKLLQGSAPETVLSDFAESFESLLGPLSAAKVDSVPNDFCLRLFYLTRHFSDEAFEKAIGSLKPSGTELSRVRRLRAVRRENLDRDEPLPEKIVALFTEFGYDVGEYSRIFPDARVEKILADENIPKTIAELAIGGEELTKLGFTGKAIGQTLRRLLTACLEQKTENTVEALIREAKNERQTESNKIQ